MKPIKSKTDSAETIVLAHPSLGRYLDGSEPGLRVYLTDSFRVEYIDYIGLTTADAIRNYPVLLPVNTEHQADQLQSVRAQHPMALLIAITNDVTGHPTYYAIRSGATFVVNLAIPNEYQSALVQSQLYSHTRDAVTHETSAQSKGTATGADAHKVVNLHTCIASTQQKSTANGETEDFAHIIGTETSALGRSELELISMLRTPMTIAEIARQNYMSERSMYRRIRKIYQILGIAGRVELLHPAVATDPLAQAPTLQTRRIPPRRRSPSEIAGARGEP
ncbi:helix-turn-helix transcriptional regulator [Nocardia asiatica]|uniref:helix-turn-helix transcriptional regulator n=1 Tax=Nocardia asiatica TaxID=209252 RepID=UPI0024539E06|nr:hypothetical protein [Nocardia asiatica]